MVGDFSLPESADESVKEIIEYWSSLCDGDILPDRADIDPVETPLLLPGVTLVEVERDPWRFRFRLMGSEVILHYGRNLTGEWMDEAFTHFPSTLTKADLIRTAESGAPNYRIGQPQLTYEKSYVQIERVMLPFRNRGEDVGIVLIYSLLE